MRVKEIKGKRRKRLYIALAAITAGLLVAMALPLTGYVLHSVGLVQVAQAQEADDEDEAVNQRAEYWRAVRGGVEGYSAVSGQETGVLIQNGGQKWRETRDGPLSFFGASLIIAVLVAIAAKHLVRGRDTLDERTGRMMARWPAFERALHWYVAILFIILAITGLSLMFGRAMLIPLMGKEGFAAWAQLAKPVHDYLALPFAAGLILTLLIYARKMLLQSHDFAWLRSMGGLIGDRHPPSGFFNAGEKIFFWLLFFCGIAIMVSGFYLLFPNLGWERDAMQLSHIVHSASGVFLIAVSLGHIYLGSFGVEGALEGMVTGSVDEGFAKEHHVLWYEEVKGIAAVEDNTPAPDATTATPT
ncbi:MAG: formate dehydrogenase subunit gamma [Woeseiaceae bacterium]